jgi:hypothetical protein
MSEEERKRPTATDRLVSEIVARPFAHKQLRAQLVVNARAGRYHDFKSSHPTPKVLLCEHLVAAGLPDLAARVKEGEFDEDKWEADEWLAADSDAARLFQLAGGKRRVE